jgi:hypothetical protein
MQFELHIMQLSSHQVCLACLPAHAAAFSGETAQVWGPVAQREVPKKKSGKGSGYAPEAHDDAGMDIERAPLSNSLTTR